MPATRNPYFMPEADGIIKRTTGSRGRADLMVFGKGEASHKRLLLAGCDPATSLVANMVERISGVEIVSAAASSKLALRTPNGRPRFDPNTTEWDWDVCESEDAVARARRRRTQCPSA